MQGIDSASFEHFLARIQYLRDFIAFTHEDAAVLNASKTVIAPLVPVIVDAAHVRLKDLSHEHQIGFRKDLLAGYLVKLFTMDYKKSASWEALDKVSLMHMGVRLGFSGKKPGLTVEFIQAILLGYIEEILVEAITAQPDLDPNMKQAIIGSVVKVLWVQNELLEGHYTKNGRGDIRVKEITVGKTIAGGGLIAFGSAFTKFLVPHL